LEAGALMPIAGAAGPRKFVAEQAFHSAGGAGLQPIVETFPARTGAHPTCACPASTC
jgi:hypothetical protein